MVWLRLSSRSLLDRDLFQFSTMQGHQPAHHLWPDPEGSFDKTHFAPDAGLKLEGPGCFFLSARIASKPLIVAQAVFIDLKPGVGLIRRLSLPWSASTTLLRHFTFR